MKMGEILAYIFLSTPSARRATTLKNPESYFNDISIHALREEGDGLLMCSNLFSWYFYPRPPRGGQRSKWRGLMPAYKFLSTPSARRATHKPGLWYTDCAFLSTPSARRATARQIQQSKHVKTFLSTPSARRATSHKKETMEQHTYFYPRPPRGGRREIYAQGTAEDNISIHALREEGDLVGLVLA